MAIKKPVASSSKPKRLMDNQDTTNRGDSRAIRTGRMSFSTTPEIIAAIEDAAYERHMNRSRLIEAAVVAYLGLDEEE